MTENNGFNLVEDAFWRLVAARGFCRKMREPAGSHMRHGSAHSFRVFLGVPGGSTAGGVQVKRFLPSLVYCKVLPGSTLSHLQLEN